MRGSAMRKLLPLFLLFLAVPLFAVESSDNRSQSYFTFEDGGTIVRQGDDQKEVEARVNFPVYAGDEITTNRRGRAEIRLSDGNVIALDRGTQIRLGSVRDSYDGDGNAQTVIELHYGHVMLERDGDDREPVRLDTENASFAATSAPSTRSTRSATRARSASTTARSKSARHRARRASAPAKRAASTIRVSTTSSASAAAAPTTSSAGSSAARRSIAPAPAPTSTAASPTPTPTSTATARGSTSTTTTPGAGVR